MMVSSIYGMLAQADTFKPSPEYTGWVKSVAFSADGQILASGVERSIHLWDPVTGEHTAERSQDILAVD